MIKINDLDLKKWKDYTDIQTSSLWLIASRDKSQGHRNIYHGNFVPQIPNQLIRRYTKTGEVVLDLFAGSGTSLIEARKLGRHSVGLELVESVADETRRHLDSLDNPFNVSTVIKVGDASYAPMIDYLGSFEIKGGGALWAINVANETDYEYYHLVILHPPYFDIVKFSREAGDLSNSENMMDFLSKFKRVATISYHSLYKNRYAALVMADFYRNGELVPLGFQTMQIMQEVGFTLKAIVVKNMVNSRAKQGQEALWRYRALKNGTFTFAHEYVFVFSKQ